MKRFTDRQIMRYFLRVAPALFALLAAGCGGGDGGSTVPPSSAQGSESLDARVSRLVTLRGLDGTPDGADHAAPLPEESAIVRLGQLLFFSRTLSMDYDVACASCHHPALAGGDGLSLPVGVAAHIPFHLGPGRSVDAILDKDPSSECGDGAIACGPNVARNSQTVFNSGLYQSALFHDGRVQVVGAAPDGTPLVRTPESSISAIPLNTSGLLFHQAQEPLVAAREMRGFGHADMTNDAVRQRLVSRFQGVEPEGQDYVTESEAATWDSHFAAAFPGQSPQERVSLVNIQDALAAYQRSLTFVQTPWSAYIQGEAPLGESALKGALLFWGDSSDEGLGCYQCHAGDLHTDENFHNVGFPQIGRGKRSDGSDPGRQGVTRREEDTHKFRTPSLHNVALTAPYGHSGAFQTLTETIRWHANPLRGLLAQSWSGLEQFRNADLSSLYPQAMALTLRAQVASNFRADLLPMRDLSEREVDALLAYLDALTDPCAASEACLQKWVPEQGADPDGNMLVSGTPSPVDAVLMRPIIDIDEQTPPSDGGGGAPVAFEALPTLATFPELGACTPSWSANLGMPLFVSGAERLLLAPEVSIFPVPEWQLGPDFQHGFDGGIWFSSLVDVESVMIAGGVLATYIDGDCWPDIAFAGGSEGGIRVYRNNMGLFFNHLDGAITDVDRARLGANVAGLAAADLDGDFRRELILGNLFTSSELLESPKTRDHIVVLGSRGDGSLYEAAAIPTYRSTYGMSLGDVDGDGDLDLFAGHWGAGQSGGASILFENRISTESDIMPADAMFGVSHDDGLIRDFIFSPAFWDVDRDGWADLTLAADFGTSVVLRNAPGESGRVFEKAVPETVLPDENGMGSAVGDYDNDGDFDWFVTSIYDQDGQIEGNWGGSGNRLYANQSSSQSISFLDVTAEAGVADGAWGWAACMADFNNDGWLDIYHENGFGMIPESLRTPESEKYIDYYKRLAGQFLASRPRLFINNGYGDSGRVTFSELGIEWGLDGKTNGRGIVCFDYDRDGDIDVVTIQNSGPPAFYINQTGRGPGRRFVNVRVVGQTPNTEAVGAIVKVFADTDGSNAIGKGEMQVRQAAVHSNFASQNPPDLHFGLGDAGQIALLTVQWPGDPVPLECFDVAVNQFLVFDQRTKACP